MPQHDIGLIGLAVMGQNLVLNMANHGFSVGVFNRTTSVTDEFVGGLKTAPADKVHAGTAERIAGYHSVEDLVRNLARPRKVMMMVKAGPAVDDPVRLGDAFGVTLAADQHAGGVIILEFDGLGIGRVASRTFRIRRGATEARLTLSSYGRPRRW